MEAVLKECAADRSDDAVEEPRPLAKAGDGHHGAALILGASRGLGAAIARACTARGMRTIELGRGATTDTPERRKIHCDLGSSTGTLMALGTLEQRPSAFRHFFWVAGVWERKRVAEQTSGAMLQIVDVNFRNALLVAAWAWRMLAHRQVRSTFTVIASASGLTPKPDEAVYTATKFAQVGFARALALENHNPNVRVALFCPGGMRTGLFGDAAMRPEEYAAFMDPAKVADHIVRRVLATDAAYLEEAITRDSSLGQSLR